MTELDCIHCGARIPIENIRTDLRYARCRACGTLSGLEPKARVRKDFAPPDGLVLTKTNLAVAMTWRWTRVNAVVCAGGALVIALLTFLGGESIDELLAKRLHFWGSATLAAVFTYLAVAFAVNSSHLMASRDLITLRHGPLPMLGSLQLRGDDVEQLVCRENRVQTRSGEKVSYSVHAILREGGEKLLVDGRETPELPLFIEQELEELLGLRDMPATGEPAAKYDEVLG